MHGLSGNRFLGYIQNHDQVGNRPFGDRLHVEAGPRKARLAAAMVMMAPFVPMIFQGEEFASSSPFLYFADHEDPELARAVSEGRRREHAHDGDWESIPDPESQETFDISKLKWTEIHEPAPAAMLEWYRALVQLRNSQPSLLDGNLDNVEVQFDESQLWLSLRRGTVLSFYNFSDGPVSISHSASCRLLLASDADVRLGKGSIDIPGFGFVALNVA
jgi:maltooligosyltrehalose trehalohydrolase